MRFKRMTRWLMAALCCVGFMACKDATDPEKASTGSACKPVGRVISDFTYSTGAAKDQTSFGQPGETFSGKIKSYGTGVTADVTGNDFHVEGSISGNAGVQIYFDNNCVADASPFQGISFDTWGNFGASSPSKTITFWVGTVEDSPTTEWLNSIDGGTASSSLPPTPGSCTPTSGDRIVHPGCRNPSYTLELSGTSPKTVTVKWTDFANGQPNVDASPGKITLIGWRLPSPAGSGTAAVDPYTLDLHIDNLVFIPR